MQLIALVATLALSHAANGWKGKGRSYRSSTKAYRSTWACRAFAKGVVDEYPMPWKQTCEHRQAPKEAVFAPGRVKRLQDEATAIAESAELVLGYTAWEAELEAAEAAEREAERERIQDEVEESWEVKEFSDRYAQILDAQDEDFVGYWDEIDRAESERAMTLEIAPEEQLIAKFHQAHVTA